MGRGGGRPVPGEYPVRFGVAELQADADWPGGWLLSVGGVAQSYVDLDDPLHLEFDYMRRMGDVLDQLAPGPLRAVHLGGAGCTLPRYIAATRPGSRQVVFDPDAELIDLVREQLDLRSVPGLKVRIGDGRSGLGTLADDFADLVVADVFASARMPAEMATVQCVREVARVLRPHGSYLLNLADGRGLAFARRMCATVAAVFEHVVLLAEPGVLRGRRFGNIVLAACREPLPVTEIATSAHSAAFPARCVSGAEVTAFHRGAQVIDDDEPAPTPVVPPMWFDKS